MMDMSDTAAEGTRKETPDEETPATQALTTPTLAQLMHMSGEAAKLSGHAFQHMGLVNQTMGQRQQIASLGQQGQGAAVGFTASPGQAPAKQSPGEGAEGHGAGADTHAGQRVPIAVTVAGTEQATRARDGGR
jgi:hypothetical protein